jgi:hypothetical protein
MTMARKTAHEPQAEVMSADDVWADAHRLAQVLRRNASGGGHVVHLQIPLAAYLSALEDLTEEELAILRQRIEERLAAC